MRNDILASLEARDLDRAKALLALPEPEVAEMLEDLPPARRAAAFRLLSKDAAIAVFEALEPDTQRELLLSLAGPEPAEVLEGLDPDDRARLLDEIPARLAKHLIAQLRPETRASVHTILNYPPDSAGRVASPAYVAVRRGMTAENALSRVRSSSLAREHLTTVFVIDDDRRYLGLVRLADLVRAAPETPIGELVEGAALRVGTTEPATTAARMLQRRDLEALPVVDSEDRLVGAVTVDDAIDVLEEDASETMYRKAGLADPTHAREVIRSERLTAGGILYPVRVRLAFLLVTLAGGLAVGGLIDRFEDTLTAVVALAVFIPLVMDMGGNVGTQSTTIFARGLALGHIDLSRFRTHLWREARVGISMACLIGLVGGAIAWAWQGVPNGVPELGVAVGVALFSSVFLACLLGFLLPYVLLRLGLDHAPGADPFITTIKDFSGLAIYFSMAAFVLGIAA